MNALVEIRAPDLPIEGWWQEGEGLLTQRGSLDWRIADWMADGAKRYGAQACFDFAADKLSLDPKLLRSSVKVSSAFPPSLRAPDVSFEVHAYIAQLPEERRLATLQRASTEHWGVKQAKTLIVTHRQENAMFEDEDAEARFATLILRAWNNAPKEAREYAWPILERAMCGGFTVADEDQVADA